MSGWIDAAECEAVLWAAGLCALLAAGTLLRVLPSDAKGLTAGLVNGIALGMLVAVAWYLAAICSAL